MEQKKSRYFKIFVIMTVITFGCFASINVFLFDKIDKIKKTNLKYNNKIKTFESLIVNLDNDQKIINDKIEELNNIENKIINVKKEYFNNIKMLENKIQNNETDIKIAYLTFDDGPYHLTEQFLKILKENDILATFFVIGAGKELCYDNYNYNCHEVYKKITDDEHTIANHTYSHSIFYGLYSSSSSFITQVKKQEDFIKEKTGVVTNIVRFPGGSSTAGYLKNDIIVKLREIGYGFVDWTASNGDGGNLPSREIAWNNMMKTINQKIEVVLMHDYNYITLSMLPDLITYLKNNNYILLPLFYESTMINK